MDSFPRISFGIIVLNGEPFIRYNLRALYPFAYEIIVVEGAVESAAVNATPDGHSLDDTLETLKDFKAQEDPEDKLIIITCDGFWEEKDAMSQAYAARATGDYLWQIDVDEFYLPDDMQRIIAMLRDDPTISAMTFRMITFWGAPQYTVDGWYLRRGARDFHRLFRWGTGYCYVTHRPPTVHNAQGRDVRSQHWLDADATAEQGIFMYHYSLLFPQQVEEKSRYYRRVEWGRFEQMEDWVQNNYLSLNHPFRVHNVYEYPSWLQRFTGQHHAQIEAMLEDIQAGKITIQTRQNADVEALLKNPTYILLRFIVKRSDGVSWWLRPLRRFLGRQRLRLLSGGRKILRLFGLGSRQKS
jgi:glycosyltransferase involved in cell wall biosynthesis